MLEPLMNLYHLEVQYMIAPTIRPPIEVNLIGHSIKIHIVPLKEGVDYREHPQFGLCVYSSRSIYLLEGSTCNTVYHELLHMYLHLIGCRNLTSFANEEEFVEYSGCIYENLRDVADQTYDFLVSVV